MSNISKKKVKYKDAKIYKTNGGKGAIIKGKYRYSLTRIWDNSKEKLLFIMLNPSTADGDGDDPTIKKIVNYADKWGYGGIYVGNLYAYRTSKPSKLKKLTDELEKKGPENEKFLRDLISKTEKVVYAWGNGESEPEWLKSLVKKPYIIELSTKGVPKHPLSRGKYAIRQNATLQLYRK